MAGKIISLKTGIVILNYNDYKNTADLVKKIYSYSVPDLICVVDNCSTDESYCELLKLQDDKCRVIQNAANNGYAAGNNYGCRYLIENYNVDILMIANPDVRFPEKTVRAMIDGFAMYPDYAIIAPLMYNADGTVTKRPYIRIPTSFQDMMLCFYTYNRYDERKRPYLIRNDTELMQVDAVQGSFWAVRADVLKKADYMDEGTFLFYEEMCMALRVKRKFPEAKIGLLTGAAYTHYHSVTIRSNLSVMKTYRTYMQSKEYFERKYYGTAGLKLVLLKMLAGISCAEEWILIHIKRQERQNI